MRKMLALFALSLCLSAEDYRCNDDAGCTARINNDGVVEEVAFRKGDMVSTEDGWFCSTDDGWVKVGPTKRMRQLAAGFVWSGGLNEPLGLVYSPTGVYGGWSRRLPPLICLL